MKKLIVSEKELLKVFAAVSAAVLFCVLIWFFLSGQTDILTKGFINGAAKDNEYIVESMASEITASVTNESQAVKIIQSAPSSGFRYWFLLSSDSLVYEKDLTTTAAMGNLSYSGLEAYYIRNGGIGVDTLFELIKGGQDFSVVMTKRSTMGAELVSAKFIQIGSARYCLGTSVSESYILSAAGIGERIYNLKIMTLLLCLVILALTSFFALSSRKKSLQIKSLKNELTTKNVLVQQQSERIIFPDSENPEKSDDALTGLYNRKFFDSLISKLSARNVENVGFIYIRISNLLALSDEKGPDAINQLIKDTANVLIKHTDVKDVCARISKKEFVIVKFNTTKDETALAVHSLFMDLNALGSEARFAAGSSFKESNIAIESALEEAYEIQSV